MKIAVAGIGYVGLSIATLLSQKNEVIALDVVSEKVDMVNNRISPIKDEYIEKFFKEKELKLKATLNYKTAFKDADYIIVSTPTNYDDQKNYFDTSSVEDIIEKIISINKESTIIIKSTIPIGFTKEMKQKYNNDNILFSPEFLREGNALYDNLYPSRIIIGDKSEKAIQFVELLKKCIRKRKVPTFYMSSTEAEAVKLFANTFLALRVAYFNELDTYAELKQLNTQNIIAGVCSDPRIGDYYNNPSFGYGGYCLPKDTKQLYSNYKDIPQSLIKAIIESNETRKNHITDMSIKEKPNIIGIYRLTMKTNSDNFRSSAILDIINKLRNYDCEVIIYEPTLNDHSFEECKIINNLFKFNELSDIIVINRYDNNVKDFTKKTYSRDVFNRD